MMATEIPPSIFGVSRYHVPKDSDKAEPGNTNYQDLQSMYVGNVQKMKYLA